MTFSFNPFVTLVKNFKVIPSPSSKLLHLNQDHSSKKYFFWSNPYKIEVMITSHITSQTLVTWSHFQHDLSHMIKFHWWRNSQELWRHKLYFDEECLSPHPWAAPKKPILNRVKRIYPVNESKWYWILQITAGYCGFVHIHWRIINGKLHFCAVIFMDALITLFTEKGPRKLFLKIFASSTKHDLNNIKGFFLNINNTCHWAIVFWPTLYFIILTYIILK